MVGKTNAGGGGGTSKAFAVISVTYPTGSTCTCTDGSKTLKLKDTSGQGIFLIPYAGEWTVTISQSGKQPTSQIVNVTESKAYTVQMTFMLVLYDNGEIPEGINLQGTAWDETYPTKGSFVLESNRMRLSAAGTSICVSPDNAIDVTSYSTLSATVYSTSRADNRAYLCLRPSLGLGWNFESMSTKINIPIDSNVSVDITNISGLYYPCILLWSVGSDYPYTLDIYKFYME